MATECAYCGKFLDISDEEINKRCKDGKTGEPPCDECAEKEDSE